MEELLGDDDLILVLMCKRLHIRNKHLTIQIHGLGLLGKDHGNAKFPGTKSSNTDAGGLNGHDFCNGFVSKAALEFPTDFFHQSNVHLVVEKAVYLQHITGLDNTVFYNSFF